MERSAYALPALPHDTVDPSRTATRAQIAPRAFSDQPVADAAPRTESVLQSVLDHLHVGLVVVDPAQQVQFANQAALHACSQGLPLSLDGGRFTVLGAHERERLQPALAAVRGGRWSLVMLSQGEQPLPVVVLPLWLAGGAEPSALLILGVLGPQRCLSMQFFAQACGLTAAEARVMRELAEGQSPRTIARRHEVALSTVRTQIGNARAKTGAHSITELVRAVGALPPVMPAALGRAVHRVRDAPGGDRLL